MALAAIHVADRAASDGQRTFGLYRLEILAALANAVLLFAVAIYVVVEAVRRWGDPPDVLVGPMLVVADRRPGRQRRRVRPAARGVEGEPERRGRLPRGAVRPGGLGGGDRGGRGHRRDRLGLGRPGGRRGDRRVHPAPHVAARRPGRAHPGAGGAPGARPGGARDDAAGPRRGGRRARPPRVDAHLRDGRGVGPPHGVRGHRHPRGARPGPGRDARPATASTTPPCRSSPTPTRAATSWPGDRRGTGPTAGGHCHVDSATAQRLPMVTAGKSTGGRPARKGRTMSQATATRPRSRS